MGGNNVLTKENRESKPSKVYALAGCPLNTLCWPALCICCIVCCIALSAATKLQMPALCAFMISDIVIIRSLMKNSMLHMKRKIEEDLKKKKSRQMVGSNVEQRINNLKIDTRYQSMEENLNTTRQENRYVGRSVC